MILRNAKGELIIVNRRNFTCDTDYHKYIYQQMIPFSNMYKTNFTINTVKSNIDYKNVI